MTAVRAAVLWLVVLSPAWAAAQEETPPAKAKAHKGKGHKARHHKTKAHKAKADKARADKARADKATADEADATAGDDADGANAEADGAAGGKAGKSGDKDKAADKAAAGESSDDAGAPGDQGAEENPKAPVTEFDEVSTPAAEAHVVAPPPGPAEYPIERALRPITLPRRMAEVTLDAPNTFNPYVQSGLLGVRYGISDQIQAGLRYGTGTLDDGDYITGKTVSIDAEYQVFDWLAGQLSVPMMVDPFSAGITLGAPMKFTFIERLRFDLFRDFVTFKLSRFAPSVVDAAFDDRMVEADRTNSVIEDGEINFNAGATWQLQPQIAIEGRYGLRALDFELQSDSPMALDVGLIYSGSNKVDIGGRLGFADLNHTDRSFGLWLLAALRI